ncbi:MAG: methylenetetrahydrofolate reductase [Pseudomonadota bacterium]
MALRWSDWGRGEEVAPQVPVFPDEMLAIQTLSDGYSIELTPKQAAKIGSLAAHLSEKTGVFITHLPDADLAENMQLTARLKREGLTPVPHLAARNFVSKSELAGFVQGIVDAGADEALIIAGGAAAAAGPFATSLDVLHSGLIDAKAFKKIYIAGHPEGHADADEVALAQALQEKSAFARSTGIPVEIVSQFGFEAEKAIAWENRLFEAGNRLPVRFGLAGPTSFAGLVRYASMCGVASSARFVGKHGHKITRLATDHAPDCLVVGFANHRSIVGSQRIAGIHFFPFGGFAKTAAWADALRKGTFKIKPNRSGFVVS